MSSASPQSEVFVMRSLTPAEVDHLATISAISFVVGALAMACVLGVALAVDLKTKAPGRRVSWRLQSLRRGVRP